MPDNELASTLLRPDGQTLLTPPLRDGGGAYRVVLEGEFRFAHSGERFDALYRAGADGLFDQRHPYLQWQPRAPLLESEDPARHRYVFRIPAGWKMNGQSVGVRVDVDRFVQEFLITPSEVRSSLSGELKMTVLQTPVAPPNPWPLVGWASVPALALAGGVGWVVRRRIAFRGLSPDLLEKLDRIERQYRAARSAVRPEDARQFPLHQRMAALRDGSYLLARRVQELRDTRHLTAGETLQLEVEAMHTRLGALVPGTARRDCEEALAGKRKALIILDDLKEAEERYELRLERIEATLHAAHLSLRAFRLSDTAAEEAVCRDLQAEVDAIHECSKG